MTHTLPRKKKGHLRYIIIPKLKKVLAIKKELQEKQKLPSKRTPRDAIAFTQMFDGLMAHPHNFMVAQMVRLIYSKIRCILMN
jgi:hypothetical protein